MKKSDPENWEKYALLMMALMGYILLASLSFIAVWRGLAGAETIVVTFGVLVFGSIAGMIIRKVSKYSNLARLSVTTQGVEIEMERKESETDEG